jgi:threonine/homoserine/homoserine lactone efflux protein
MFVSLGDQIVALLLFSAISGCTPGPNNVMLLASGVNFGFRRTIPHIVGVSIGSPLMVASVALGVGSLFRAEPRLRDLIEVAGVLYLSWLAWRIAATPVAPTIGGGARSGGVGRPMGFWTAVGFQWLNVKAWVVAISAVSVYVPESWSAIAGAGLLFSVMFVTAALATVMWAGFGSLLARFLQDPIRRRLFNLIMAILLMLSLWPAFADIAGWIGLAGGRG